MFNKQIVILLAAILLFTLFQPRLKLFLFPGYRAELLHEYILSAKKSDSFDAITFWRFREFYAQGSFTLNRKGIPSKKYTSILSTCSIRLMQHALPFLSYEAADVHSIDLLTKEKKLDRALLLHKKPKSYISRSRDNFVYYTKDALCIVFLKKNKEMKTVQAFLDYKERDKQLVKGRNWLSITAIKK